MFFLLSNKSIENQKTQMIDTVKRIGIDPTANLLEYTLLGTKKVKCHLFFTMAALLSIIANP